MTMQKNELPKNDAHLSVCPSGEAFSLPDESEYLAEYEKLKATVADQRKMGREIVVVMGVGFVGAVMAGVVADSTRDETDVEVHDPYVKHWWELEKQDSYPAPGKSWARFFRNQDDLSSTRMHADLSEALADVDAVVLAVRHRQYLELTPEDVLGMTRGPVAVIDCFGILDDDAIQRYFELGCEVKGLGRGHVQRIKEMVRSNK